MSTNHLNESRGVSSPHGVRLARREFLGMLALAPTSAGRLLRFVMRSRDHAQGGDSAALLHAAPHKPSSGLAPGMHDLNSLGAKANLYIPASYSADRPTPVLVLLHGAAHDRNEWMQPPLLAEYDRAGVIVLSPDSTGGTWDMIRGEFGPDVRLIDAALDVVFGHCNVDPSRIALGGFSDGATYALALGLANGTLFSALLVFSPGFLAPLKPRGQPRIFIAHGTEDPVLSAANTRASIVPRLRADGYDVVFEAFRGVHGIYLAEVTNGLKWFLPGSRPG